MIMTFISEFECPRAMIGPMYAVQPSDCRWWLHSTKTPTVLHLDLQNAPNKPMYLGLHARLCWRTRRTGGQKATSPPSPNEISRVTDSKCMKTSGTDLQKRCSRQRTQQTRDAGDDVGKTREADRRGPPVRWPMFHMLHAITTRHRWIAWRIQESSYGTEVHPYCPLYHVSTAVLPFQRRDRKTPQGYGSLGGCSRFTRRASQGARGEEPLRDCTRQR